MPKSNLKYFILFVSLLYVTIAKAQLGKEAWHWQFGQNAAIDFSSGTPVTGTCAVNTSEGSASVSDPNTGQLLFYTDGTKAWDKNNNQMPNGFGMIGGNGTSTQAALIVPKPGSSTIYYLISADQGGYVNFNQGVNYSVVDMSLNGGLGDVTTKNILLTSPPATEKLTAIKHCNGTDYWIITHSFNSNSFNAYLISSTGINSTPIVSNIGTIQNDPTSASHGGQTIGYLKASPNGKKVACAVSDPEYVELFDFDNSTGILSNPIKINYMFSGYETYGVAFSPDNSKLYTTLSDSIYQYDVSSNNASTIIASQINISKGMRIGSVYALQLASDGKIYIALFDSAKLSVINNPNGLGAACNFQPYGPLLEVGSLSQAGLPNFIEANNALFSQHHNIPLCSFLSYTLNASAGSNYNWSTGSNTISIAIADTGKYWVDFFNGKGCKESDTFYVNLTTAPVVNNLHNAIVCSNLLPFNVDATYPNVTNYMWSDSSMLPNHSFVTSGNYWIDYYFNNCTARDSFEITIKNILPPADFPNIVTPNNDGINDFIDFNKYQFSSLQLEIYNRWGKKVFESISPACIWKPTEEDGIYFLIVNYSFDCEENIQPKSYQGFVTIIR